MFLPIIEAEKAVPWQSAESRKDYAWKPESGEIGWGSQGSPIQGGWGDPWQVQGKHQSACFSFYIRRTML